MNEELRKQLELLERGIDELKQATTQALGFIKTVEYKGIAFNVSRRFVIADLSPLAFFHLIEAVDKNIDNAIEHAIIELYNRLLPLLGCRHEWTQLRRSDDEKVLAIMTGAGSSRPFICKHCTAYALEQSLPVVGRDR
jgi:hypothetical protein